MRYRIKRLVRRLLGQHTNPGDGLEMAAILKAAGRIQMGDDCSISPRARITDPDYLLMGDNVRIADARLFGHDGSINMVNQALGTAFDAVGPIMIGNNVFIGDGATVQPNTVIGDNVIIGLNAVVKGHIAGGFVYVGSPARAIRTFEEHIALLEERHKKLPSEWRDIIAERGSAFDPVVEPRLIELRRQHFFGATA